MGSGEDVLVYLGVNVELLDELSAKRVSVSFVREALSAGELPMPRQVSALWAEGQKEFVVTRDDGGYNDNRLQTRAPTPNVS